MAATRRLEYRVIVGFTEPQWTAARTVNFNSAGTLDPKLFKYSFIGGPPSVDASGAHIKSYGNPPFEWIQTRALWVPRSWTKPFALEVDVVFPVGDPVYSMALTFGGIDNALGVEGEPLQIVQKGSAYAAAGSAKWVEGSNVGGGGTGTYRYEYSGTPSALCGPARYVHWGYIHPLRKQASKARYAALGTPSAPATLMTVTAIRSMSFGAGYEAEVWPAWTTANAGGTVETANPRLGTPPLSERYVDDNITWAIMPRRYIKGLSFSGPDTEDVATGSLVLSGLTGLFRNEPWQGRIIMIDTRMHVKPSTYTEWRRQAVFEVGTPTISRKEIKLPLMDRVSKALSTPMSQAFLGQTPDANALGEIDAVNRDYRLPAVAAHTVQVGDIVRGSPVGMTDYNINLPAILPNAVDSGGDSALGFLLGIGDKLAQQSYQRFRRTGVGKYGQFLMHLHQFGDKATDWTYYGVDGALKSTIVRDSLHFINSDEGPSHINYRQNNPTLDGQQSTLTNLPGIGRFPTGYYPTNAPEVDDSWGLAAANIGMSPAFPFPDKAGANKYGGIAKFRYFTENLVRRTIEFDVRNIDFHEPGQYINIDDPGGSGILATEKWIVTGTKHKIEKGRLITTVRAHTATIAKALEYTYAS